MKVRTIPILKITLLPPELSIVVGEAPTLHKDFKIQLNPNKFGIKIILIYIDLQLPILFIITLNIFFKVQQREKTLNLKSATFVYFL